MWRGLRHPKFWLIFGAGVAINVVILAWGHVRQVQEDAVYDTEFMHRELLPLAVFVEKFREQNHRLPTEAEFDAWAQPEDFHRHFMTSYYSKKPEFMTDWGKDGDAFMVGKWTGEGDRFYCSWNHRTFYEDYGDDRWVKFP